VAYSPLMAAVLLVEDNEELAEFVRSALLKRAHQVTIAGTAEDALDRLKAGERFEALVLDGLLPGMDGAELVRELDESSIAPIPTILTSATIDLSRVKSKRWPIVERVEKPFQIEVLINAVENAARRGASGQSL